MPKIGNKNNNSTSVPTLAEYITQQIAAKKAAALDKSRNRTSVRVPMVLNNKSEEEWRNEVNLAISHAKRWIGYANAVGDTTDLKLYQDFLDKKIEESNKGYAGLMEGLNCIYNAGDCYGLNIPGNQTFANKYKEKGFKRVDSSNMEPGDIVQVVNYNKTPVHAMIFDSKDKNGKPLYNYAKGRHSGVFNEDYVKQGRYPMEYNPLVYRYVGTPADSTQWINEYKQRYGNGMRCGGRRKAQLGLDIREGGIAIPIAPNMYYMDGRSHDDGGIAIGPNNKNGLEVEGGEVVKVGSNDIKVFSSVPLLRGVSPAQLVMGGANPNKVFKAQEDFKDRNRINDDGTTYELGGNRVYTPSKAIQKQLQETGKVIIGGAPTIGGLKTYKYLRGLTNIRKYGDIGTNIFRAGKEFIKRGTDRLVKDGKITRNVAQVPRSIYAQFVGGYGQNLPKTVNLFTDNEMRLGGRVKAEFGVYQPRRNEKGQVILDPNNPNDVKWLHEQQGKRGAKAVHEGQQEFLEGALNRTTPIVLGVAAANPITTGLSLAGSYLLGKVGETGGQLYKNITGEDYVEEGKNIGQTMGAILGSPVGRLIGNQVTNAYKTARLNSTQTLITPQEEGLIVRQPTVSKTPPKQIEQTNTQKYLPTEVEDLTWKEPKALLETEAQVTRRDLKNFNRWAKLFGYEPVPLRYAETKSIADRHVQDRIIQHNTFLRGVAKPNKPQRQAIEYELAKEGINNPTEYDVYNYMATHSAPTTGAGRADLRPIQVRKHKVGNFNLSKTSDSPIGALYTQGSGRGAAGYAGMGPESGGHRRTGVVVEVARPTNFRPGASYAEWVKENDFNFGNIKSKGFHKKVADRVVETGKAPEAYNLPDEYKQTAFNDVKAYLANEEIPNYDVISNALQYIKTTHPQYLRKVTQLEESAFNMLSNAEKKAYKEYLGEAMISPKVHTSFKIHIDKENNKFKDLYKKDIISASKQHRNKYLTDIDYNSEDYTQPDFSVLKSTSRNRGNAQQHYIFRAPIGEKVLEGRGFYLPTEEEIINATTNHYTPWTPGYSRNTRKFGGIKKFKFGGSMLYTINGNVKNGLMSARPKAQYGTIDKKDKDVKVGQDGLIYKRAADGEWYTDGTKHVTARPIVKNSRNELVDVNSSLIPTIIGPNGHYERVKSIIPKDKKIITRKFDKPKRTYVSGYAFEDEEKETKKIGSLTYEKNEDGKWIPASKQSITTTRDGGRPKDFGMTRTGVNHPNGSYKYHPLTGEKISEMGIVEISEPSVKGTTKVSSSTSSTPRGRGTNTSKATTSTKPAAVETKQPKLVERPKENLYITGIKNNAVKSPLMTGMEKISAKPASPSTGGGTQPKDGNWVPQYNLITGRDWLGVGTNLAGHIASYFANRDILDKYPMPTKPVMTPAAKLKTRVNINPDLTNSKEAELMGIQATNRNTSSSNTSLARNQRIMNESRDARNKLYAYKENAETQLINQDKLNRQGVYARNVAAYNDWLNKTFVAKTNKLLSKQQNLMNLINGIPMAVNNVLGNIETRKSTNDMIHAIAAANPNGDGRLLGIGDYYTQQLANGKIAKYNKNHKFIKYV